MGGYTRKVHSFRIPVRLSHTDRYCHAWRKATRARLGHIPTRLSDVHSNDSPRQRWTLWFNGLTLLASGRPLVQGIWPLWFQSRPLEALQYPFSGAQIKVEPKVQKAAAFLHVCICQPCYQTTIEHRYNYFYKFSSRHRFLLSQ
jgi:hypothetical protein